MEGHKVIRSSEMARIEKLSFDEGASGEAYMETAGEGIARIVEKKVAEWNLMQEVTLLVGRGNNGGDAFVAGTYLLDQGFEVNAYHLFDLEDSSPLCQQHANRFKDAGGEIFYPDDLSEIAFFPHGLIIDGIFGTGFHGKAEGDVGEVINLANEAKIPIISIDIPSAFTVNAKETIYLGLPKTEFFEKRNFDFVGKLSRVDFGLDMRYVHEAVAEAHLLSEKNLEMPPIRRTRHKYEAGYVVGLAGSKAMSGAAMLAGLSALKTGAGIVRIFHEEGMHACPPHELILNPYVESHFLKEAKRATAFLLGPGLGTDEVVKTVIDKLSAPCVIDADALACVNDTDIVAPHILTPHRGEMQRLLGCEPTRENCQAFVDERGATLVLKGAPTTIFHPGCLPLIVTAGDPGMATAGSGDVLSGMLAALLAQGMNLREAAALGVYLHGKAGEIAALKNTSYSMIASDLIQAVNFAIPSLSVVLGE
ncbi:MAG: Bifunctional NAD(P)H-hydrate repair enzyme Nnr [Chlamydiia bacterium]|nr:Bifunctional NAD(P)H-hydrate repair enzyme Nnr [Chlamydiia bacterium]MCH9616245.1 Bifunctional NAD(P)H-hydrate repair enzyme Nnr [Chlamydiia bacterium]MCH9629769.1 Bifunctional NAD(P)H-hydrate repair enzyme Nnr [Chlamydiia bacterium]